MNDLEAAELIRMMERWGYRVVDQPHHRSPGFNRLLVVIRAEPTEDHYDPEAVHLQLCGAQGMPMRLTIQRETNFSANQKLCPGSVDLTDRIDVRRGFFTFGATVDKGRTGGQSVIEIQSPAPILELAGGMLGESVGEQLVSETEALWAKARVHWGMDDIGFVRKLGSIHPEALYAATVNTLWRNYQDSTILRQTYPQFNAMLRRELEWVKTIDVAYSVSSSLDEMLKP